MGARERGSEGARDGWEGWMEGGRDGESEGRMEVGIEGGRGRGGAKPGNQLVWESGLRLAIFSLHKIDQEANVSTHS